MKLETNRTLIRPVVAADCEAMYSYRSDARTNQYQSWVPKNIEEMQAYIAKFPTEYNVPNTWFQLAIVDKESQDMIGDIGVHFKGDDNCQIEFGCTLKKAKHGKGYANESVSAVLNSLFYDYNKHRAIASIDPLNKASIAMVERLGFRKEAHFKESLFINGSWVDDIIYAVLQKEWMAKQEKK